MTRLHAVVLAGLLAGSPVLAATLGERFTLGLGETASIEAEELALTFVRVAGDNRCPKDVQCIVAGAATVVLAAATADSEAELTFEAPPDGGDRASFESYEIHLEAVEPPTRSNRRIEPDDYRVTLSVTRASDEAPSGTSSFRSYVFPSTE